jgi:hypothetical protein
VGRRLLVVAYESSGQGIVYLTIGLLTWSYEPGMSDHSRMTFVIEHREKTYCLHIQLDDSSAFPYHRDDRVWALRYQLEMEEDPAFYENLFQFLDKPDVQVTDYIESAIFWAEKVLLTPMEILALAASG